MQPRRALPPYDWAALLTLIQAEFAYLGCRISPPSSMHLLTADAIARPANSGEIFVIEAGGMTVARIFLTPKPPALYLGKLAVARSHRGTGLARQLIDLAETRAQALGLPVLDLQTRIELVENHAAFAAMGFAKVAETAHEGFDRPTSITMQRPVRQTT